MQWLDAKQGFGQVAGEYAGCRIFRAKKFGVSVVGLRNSGHLGRIGDWAERAADEGLVSFHFVNVRGSHRCSFAEAEEEVPLH